MQRLCLKEHDDLRSGVDRLYATLLLDVNEGVVRSWVDGLLATLLLLTSSKDAWVVSFKR